MKMYALREENMIIKQLPSQARLLVGSLMLMFLMFSFSICEIRKSALTSLTTAFKSQRAPSTMSLSANKIDWTAEPVEKQVPLDMSPTLLKRDVLDNFLDIEVERLVDNSNIGIRLQLGMGAASISHVMSALAISVRRFATQTGFSELALSELASAINAVELAADKAKNKEFVPKFKFISQGLLDVLDDSSSDILAHTDRSLSGIGIGKLRKFSQSSSEQRDQELREFLAKSRALAEAKQAKTGHSLLKFLSSLVQGGTSLVDQLYLSPLFVEKLPVIGKILVDLKKKGKTTYQLINSIRSLRSVMDMYREIKLKRNFKEETEPKKMLTDLGMDALRWLAHRLANKYTGVKFGPDGIEELVRRSAHHLLLYVVTKLPSCAFSNT